MDHDKAHSHSHEHGRPSSSKRRLTLTLLLSGGYMIAEVVGGLITNSLALLADAGHMLADVAALGLTLFAVWIAERPPTSKRTFGYYRAEILAALFNGATLIAISISIFIEAYHRLWQPPEIRGGLMMGIACGGLIVNILGLWILGTGRGENLNLHGAWLHVLTDALGSVGAILAAILIWAFGWLWADPMTSILIGMLVIFSSWRLLAESVSVLMESAPSGIDVDEVRSVIRAVPGVSSVHDLHVWSITSGMNSLSAHVVAEDDPPQAILLSQIGAVLHERFGIDHVTIQIEPTDFEEHTAHV
ncbi:MAG: cation diffusion facilitator family transporter [Gemmataceae bacterium]|nr:cation diffusion facilitator family transporter [Gemmataceae bacterium]